MYSTDDAARTFITSTYLPNATNSEIEHLFELYPQDVAQGSPFGTGDRNVLSPQSKRLAALQGDILITGPRRYFLQHLSDKQPAWSFSEYQSLDDMHNIALNVTIFSIKEDESVPRPWFCQSYILYPMSLPLIHLISVPWS